MRNKIFLFLGLFFYLSIIGNAQDSLNKKSGKDKFFYSISTGIAIPSKVTGNDVFENPRKLQYCFSGGIINRMNNRLFLHTDLSYFICNYHFHYAFKYYKKSGIIENDTVVYDIRNNKIALGVCLTYDFIKKNKFKIYSKTGLGIAFGNINKLTYLALNGIAPGFNNTTPSNNDFNIKLGVGVNYNLKGNNFLSLQINSKHNLMKDWLLYLDNNTFRYNSNSVFINLSYIFNFRKS